MRYLLFFMLLVAVFVLGKRSCHFDGFSYGVKGSGPTRTETRDVNGFHAVELDLAGEVELRVGDYHVDVQAQDNILPLLKTSVENGALHIYFSESVSHTENIKVVITAPAFDAISLGGSGDINVTTPLQAENMSVDLGGSGTIRIPQGTFNNLRCAISGSGNIEMAGKTNTGRFELSGSGEISGKNMEFTELDADISGSGTMSANVVQVLKADVSGSGEIKYTGNPNVQSNVSGSGSVSKM